MAKILAYTTPARGHLFPIVPVLDELRARGHEIALRTLPAEVDGMRERGFAAAPIAGEVAAIALDDHQARTAMGAVRRVLKTFAARAPHDAADLRAAIDQERPAVLLIDVNAWGAGAVAEAHGAPWATWCPYPLPIPSADAPPFGPGLAPARGRAGRLRDRVLTPIVTGGYERELLPRVNRLRASLGLAPAAGTAGVFAAAPLVLSMTAEPFEYHRSDWPDSVVMVGPCAWEPAAHAPAWLEDLDRPVVLVTSSSEFQDDGRLISTALEALRNEPVAVVATVPAQDATAFAAPSNARVEVFAPHGPILERAICAVTHGGMGATQKALAHGVPVVAVPFGRDQMEVARRVAHAGAGVRLPAGRLRADRLRDAVRAAIERREGAAAVAAAFDRAGGPRGAADALERLAGAQ